MMCSGWVDMPPRSYIVYLSFNYIIAGFAFVYFEDDRDAADAIRGLDNTPFGYDRRRLSVEWARVCYYSFLFFYVYYFVI